MKKCSVCGKECKQLRRGMCEKHYKQFIRYGECKRTKYDPNEIIEYDDYAEVIIYNRDCKEKARTLIDLEDIDKVKQYKWNLNAREYVYTDSTNILLHRLIMNCPDDKVVDHINHNKLDNRKSNLRICTQQQNSKNRSICSKNTSGITGVWWYKPCGKWCAQITYNKKRIHLGLFDTLEEATQARKQAEIDLFGEYRNKDDEDVI